MCIRDSLKKCDSKPKLVAMGAVSHKVCNMIFAILRDCLLYTSDGRANSKNRYRTKTISSSRIKVNDGTYKEVNEFLHNDFEACFESYDNA